MVKLGSHTDNSEVVGRIGAVGSCCCLAARGAGEPRGHVSPAEAKTMERIQPLPETLEGTERADEKYLSFSLPGARARNGS